MGDPGFCSFLVGVTACVMTRSRATKQSEKVQKYNRKDGLLRFARNDNSISIGQATLDTL